MSIPASSLVDGLIVGLGYGLLALGLVLIYRSSRIINFAHGQLGVLSAVLLSKLVEDDHVPYLLALALALVVAAAVGAVSELVLRRLAGRPRLLVMVATIGLAQLLYLVTVLPAVSPKKLFRAYPLPFHLSFRVGHELFVAGDTLTLIVGPVVALAFGVFLVRSRLGLNLRAVAENAESARLAGVWAKRTSSWAWVLAGMLSAVTAILASPAKGSSFTQALGPELLLRALAAALLGGMMSLPIAFAAGVAIGVIQQVVAWNWPAASNIETAMFLVLLAVLVLAVRRLRRGPRDEERSSWRFVAASEAGPGGRAERVVARSATAAVLVAAFVFPFVASNARIFLVSRIYVYGLIALSLTVLTGWAGQLSLGNFGLVAVGAIVAARLGPHQPLVVVLAVAAVFGAACAVVIGIPALRIRGLYLAVTTLGFALFVQDALVATPCWRVPGPGWHVCTGLPDPASTLLRRPSFFGIALHSQRSVDWFVLAVLLVTIVFVRAWRDGGLARDLMAIRDNEVAAAAGGVRVTLLKLQAFALSGGIAGVAGVCFAYVSQRFSSTSFPPSASLLIVTMVVIGGLGSIPGALLGALYLVGLPAAFGSSPTVQFLTSGIGLLAFLLFLPGGLAELLARLQRAVAGVVGSPAPSPTDDRRAARQVSTSAMAKPVHEPAALRLRGVTVAYGGVRAVDGVDLDVRAGELLGLIGPNGSGKTTLLDAVSGLLTLAGGSIVLDGEDLCDWLPADRARLGLVRSFQDGRLFPDLTVEDALLVVEDARRPAGVTTTALHLPLATRREAAKHTSVDDAIEAFGLQRFRHLRVSELSTGTRRIVDLAGVLAARPRLLLLDEPTAGLAQREAEAFGPLLARLHELTGATIMIVEHDVPLMLALCDRIAVMETGRVVTLGTPAEIVDDPVAQAAYLGVSGEALTRSGVQNGAPSGQGHVTAPRPGTPRARSSAGGAR